MTLLLCLSPVQQADIFPSENFGNKSSPGAEHVSADI